MEGLVLTNLVKDNVINTLIAIVVTLSSVVGWYALNIVGVNYFWGIFFLLSFAILLIIMIKFRFNLIDEVKLFFKDKFNIILFAYLLWISLTYMINYQGMSSILYIFKVWWILGIYLFLITYYLKKINAQGKCDFIYKICNYIFALGIIHSVIASCQFVFDSNDFFGITLTKWQPYNPASFYSNVNGLGTYLFISVMAGLYCLFLYNKSQYKTIYIVGIVMQLYVLYLTVARTSMITTFIFIIGTFVFIMFDKKIKLRNIFTKKKITAFIIVNAIMLCVINFNTIDGIVTHGARHGHIRTAADMLQEKNSKLFNQRDLIWKAVIKDYKQYIKFGDGLEYNIVHKIDVASVISVQDKDATRISYHNTLFRYFASNGLIGMLLFLILFAYAPVKILFIMIKEKKLKAKYYFVLLTLACIFLYMQMEEVYLGEIGLTSLITLMVMAYANSILSEKKGDEI